MEIYCKKCYRIQEWTQQTNCVQCGERFSNWHIAGQLKAKVENEQTKRG